MSTLSWVTVVWSMIAAASLTLAAIYGLVWYRSRAWAPLLFFCTALSLTGFTFCELWMMRSETAAELLRAAQWAHLCLCCLLVSLIWFVAIYLRAGRLWLAWIATAIRIAFVLLIFIGDQNVSLSEVPSLRRVQFLGEPVTVLVGVPNPVQLFAQAAVVLMLIFVADACVTAWRRGDRRKALMVGGSAEFFMSTGLGMGMLVIWGHLEMPIIFGLLYLGLIAVMGYELSTDALRASQLLRELQVSEAELRESERRFRLMADTAPVMIWLAGTDKHYSFFNQRWLEFRRRTIDEETGDGWTEGIHPDDLTDCQTTYAHAFASRQPFHREYRFRRFDGVYCWLRDSGVPRLTPDNTFAGYIGSCIEITDLKRTERELRENQAILEASNKQISDLFGRLIAAQESERTRIARDLHDDVSQRIAGLSIMVSGVKRTLRGHRDEADIMGALTTIQQSTTALADEIRHLSHDLHPALIQHAGLVAALSAFCTQFESQHGVRMTYTTDGEMDRVDADVALCVYRIAQEGLRNVGKHANAAHVGVTLRRTADTVHLSIEDDGKGFELVGMRGAGAGLGLVSMDERARQLGGSVRIDARPLNGTRLHLEIPWSAPVEGVKAP